MSKIIIIGGGFGGLTVARLLSRSQLNLTLIDKKSTSDFLPTLPDCLGRAIAPEFLAFDIEEAARKWGFKFIKEEVISVNLEKKEAFTTNKILSYDYLVIASGSETNFYGNENIMKSAYKLDDVEDVKRILQALKQNESATYIIGGGGYTGVELATNLRLFSDKHKKSSKIIIVERAPKILGPLPEWMKEYANDNLRRLNIDIFTDSTIDKIEERRVYLSEGRVFENAFVVWAAGVKTAGFIQVLKAEKNPQGRLKVDEYLRINNNCFVIGDAANFSYNNNFLRMAVQFAIAQGHCVAENIMNSVQARRLCKYRPIDLGYIIPMANNRSCGRVLGLNLKGFLPTVLHFFMCIYRSNGLRNKFGIIKELLKGGGRW
jgi:NADH dehydrogenase